MVLSEKDYHEIVSMLEEGKNTLEYEKNGETLEIEYEYEENGYFENGYYNGTGAWVCTNKEIHIMNVISWNCDGEETENNFSSDRLYKVA